MYDGIQGEGGGEWHGEPDGWAIVKELLFSLSIKGGGNWWFCCGAKLGGISKGGHQGASADEATDSKTIHRHVAQKDDDVCLGTGIGGNLLWHWWEQVFGSRKLS
jgi:hypothetical protein